jgi:uncharacterized protein YndB with AHSA1/START domain
MALVIKTKLSINAPIEQVYRAFTYATILRQWFCDFATVDTKQGGRAYFWWTSGRYLTGEFTEAKPDKTLKIACRGCQERGSTEISLNLISKGKETQVNIIESGFTNEKTRTEIERRWEESLTNLKSYLENGLDLRFINRPMLGIIFGDFNAKIASELNIPVKEGIRITDVVKGLAVHKAGLMKDDVIIEISNKSITDFNSLLNVLRHKRAGDLVDVVFYRGKTKKKVSMELSRRPLPKVARTPKALADQLSKMYEAFNQELRICLKGITEEQAGRLPKKGEWSAKETLAHLIHTERGWQDWISDMVIYQERISDGFGDNLPARIKSTVDVFGTLKKLQEELHNAQQETVKFIAYLPMKVTKNKGTFWLMAYNMTQFATHPQEHLVQIKEALRKAN